MELLETPWNCSIRHFVPVLGCILWSWRAPSYGRKKSTLRRVGLSALCPGTAIIRERGDEVMKWTRSLSAGSEGATLPTP